jgi:hypothetical protein
MAVLVLPDHFTILSAFSQAIYFFKKVEPDKIYACPIYVLLSDLNAYALARSSSSLAQALASVPAMPRLLLLAALALACVQLPLGAASDAVAALKTLAKRKAAGETSRGR